MTELDTSKVAVYGTLRVGQGNWSYFLSDVPAVVEKDTISGYIMRGGWGYPAVCDSRDPKDEVVVDVFDLSVLGDEAGRRLQQIDSMEFGAGYFRRLVTTKQGHLAWMYVMPVEEVKDYFDFAIDSGDWVEFREQEEDYA